MFLTPNLGRTKTITELEQLITSSFSMTSVPSSPKRGNTSSLNKFNLCCMRWTEMLPMQVLQSFNIRCWVLGENRLIHSRYLCKYKLIKNLLFIKLIWEDFYRINTLYLIFSNVRNYFLLFSYGTCLLKVFMSMKYFFL